MNEKMRRALGFLGLIEDEYGDYGATNGARPFTQPDEYEEQQQWSPPSSRGLTNRPASTAPSIGARRMSGVTPRPSSLAPQMPPATLANSRMRPMSSSRIGSITPLARENFEVSYFRPLGFNDSGEVTELLRKGNLVVMNTTSLNADIRRRVVDFAAGTAWALGAKIEPLDPGIYIVRPNGVTLTDEMKLRLRNGDVQSFDNP
jgi:FtsZ-interacting cell division protein YlmF